MFAVWRQHCSWVRWPMTRGEKIATTEWPRDGSKCAPPLGRAQLRLANNFESAAAAGQVDVGANRQKAHEKIVDVCWFWPLAASAVDGNHSAFQPQLGQLSSSSSSSLVLVLVSPVQPVVSCPLLASLFPSGAIVFGLVDRFEDGVCLL